MLKFLFGYKSSVRIDYEQIGMERAEHRKKNKDKNIVIKNELYLTKYRRHASFSCMKIDEDLKDTTNPNFGAVITFSNVSVNNLLLCWPLLHIKFFDDEQNSLPIMQITQPLFLYIDHNQESKFPKLCNIKVALAQLIHSPNVQYTQPQENPRRTYLRRIQDQKITNQKYDKKVELELSIVKLEAYRKEIDDIDSEGNDGLENLFDDGKQRYT